MGGENVSQTSSSGHRHHLNMDATNRALFSVSVSTDAFVLSETESSCKQWLASYRRSITMLSANFFPMGIAMPRNDDLAESRKKEPYLSRRLYICSKNQSGLEALNLYENESLQRAILHLS